MGTFARQMYELSLFSGAGGGLLATQHLLGWQTICYVENAAYSVEILKARIRDGYLNDAPIWNDVRTFDGHPWRGMVDCVTAGFPCQPWATGGKGHGVEDDRNLWPDTIRVIGEVQPQWVFLENSTRLLQVSHQWGRPPYIQQIVGDLAGLGYVGRWGCISAADLGFEHKRQRLWIVAHASNQGRSEFLRHDIQDSIASIEEKGFHRTSVTLDAVWNRLARLEKRLGEPSVFRTDDGLAHRVERLAAIGEGQVPAVAATAWRLLKLMPTSCCSGRSGE